jgi:hypothetical protein
MSIQKTVSLPVLQKPRFGLFSYVGNFGRVPTERKGKEKEEKGQRKRKRIEEKMGMSYVTIGCDYQDPRPQIVIDKEGTKKIREIHNRIFRPAGAVSEKLIPYPSIPCPDDGKKQEKPLPRKNFIVPFSGKLFSRFKYEDDKQTQKLDKRFKIKRKLKKPKYFYTVARKQSCFNSSMQVYGSTDFEEPKSEEKEEEDKNSSENFSSFQSEEKSAVPEEMNLTKNDTKLKENRFKPPGRAKKDTFGTYEYISEKNFPAKRLSTSLDIIKRKPFKPTTATFSILSPGIATNPINLKREYNIKRLP